LIGGIGIAVALETLDRTVRTTTEIERSLHVPVLGFVPKVHPVRSIGRKDRQISSQEFMPFRLPWSQLADSIRVIQNTAEALMEDQFTSTICVSSALPREGKTFVSVSMATAMASEDKKVMLIEGDMRRPRLQDLFGKERDGSGLSDLLKGRATGMDQVIRKSHIPGLFYIPAGSAADNPVSLLKSQGMRKVIELCGKKFDFVFIDAPPVMGMADAGILARYSDGLILVTKQGHTPLEVLRQAQESILVGQEVHILGIVLNMVYREANEYDYYASRYGYHYDYHRGRT
jgi:capsular exopolysaccharide synthesis family protein